MRLKNILAALALPTCLFASAATAQTNPNVRVADHSTLDNTPRVLSGPVRTNMGTVEVPVFEGHDLTEVFPAGGGAILCALATVDDAAFRDALSAAAGGVVVDYFDARADTPTGALLSNYDCVFTWVNNPYADNVLFGDRLATFVDNGGTVVLGAFCTYESGFPLAGAIMGPAYCPVDSPDGTNHFAVEPYTGDGVTCLYDGVASLECNFRDILVLQGAGIQDGSYADGEICAAYRPDGRVVYANGVATGAQACAGDAAVLVANACSGCLGSPIGCACDGAYTIGQRVVAVIDNPAGNPEIMKGDTGTVVCGSNGFPPLLVFWDDFDGGHDGNNACDCPSNGDGGGGGVITLPGSSGWYVDCDEVAPACPGDLDGDLEVGFGDLLILLAGWGSCL